eukprot:1142286-Pelagomonas_calceolata.AAC.2
MLSSKTVKLKLPDTPQLMPKWIGPLQVIECVNPVVYRLQLPLSLRDRAFSALNKSALKAH